MRRAYPQWSCGRPLRPHVARPSDDIIAGINALGKEAVLEGKKARSFPLRFVDGAVFLGPLKVGQVPALF